MFTGRVHAVCVRVCIGVRIFARLSAYSRPRVCAYFRARVCVWDSLGNDLLGLLLAGATHVPSTYSKRSRAKGFIPDGQYDDRYT